MQSVVGVSALYVRAVDGDREAYSEVHRLHYESLYRFSLALVGRVADAEDATAVAFLNVWKARATIREPAKLKSFLFRATKNAAMDAHRQRPPFDPMDASDEDDDRPPVQYADSAPGPEALAERAQAQRDALWALQQIAPEYRAAVLLKDMQGFQYEEISEALDIPMGTVASRIARGRKELARVLHRRWGPGA